MALKPPISDVQPAAPAPGGSRTHSKGSAKRSQGETLQALQLQAATLVLLNKGTHRPGGLFGLSLIHTI